MKKWVKILIAVICILSLAAIGVSYFVTNVEQPKYDRIMVKPNSIETRRYPPMVVAEVTVTGSRKEAIQQGFSTLAKYIFGKNAKSLRIAMTAPVMQQQKADNQWVVRFMMPTRFSLDRLPAPENDQIHLKTLSAATYTVIQFSGMNADSNLANHKETLMRFLAEHHDPERLATAAITYAFYNPPWTLPFLRRNEIWIQLT